MISLSKQTFILKHSKRYLKIRYCLAFVRISCIEVIFLEVYSLRMGCDDFEKNWADKKKNRSQTKKNKYKFKMALFNCKRKNI
jgi:hypothetical protein